MIVAPASSGRAAICAATPKPSRSGMLASSSTSANGCPCRGRREQRVERRLAAVDGRRLHLPPRQLLVEDPAVDRVVVDDRAPAGPPASARRDAVSGSVAIPNGAVKWNVLPSPGSLSTQIRPPIMWTSVAEIVRPSPVPPNRRVVDPSAWLNASKIVACLSAGMPMPGVAHREVQHRAVVGARVLAQLDQHVPVRGELDRVADQIGEHLPQPHRIADDAGRHVRA